MDAKRQIRTKEFKQLEKAARVINNAVRLLQRMELRPMSEILDKVPGSTNNQKCSLIGVSRQTFHSWVNDRSRPSFVQGQKLEELTGIPITDITTEEPYPA